MVSEADSAIFFASWGDAPIPVRFIWAGSGLADADRALAFFMAILL
jgi:hypothetical protein